MSGTDLIDMSMIDVTESVRLTEELKAANDNLKTLVNVDLLTVFLQGFFEKVTTYDRFTYGHTLILDLDYFKSVNDKYGHEIGDKLLQRVGSVLSDFVGDNGYVARFGGEEFAVVWFGCDNHEISIYANKLRLEVADAFVLSDGSRISRTASIGVAFFNDKDIRKKGFSDALKLADKACLEAKKEGRNRVVLATDKVVNKWEREGFF